MPLNWFVLKKKKKNIFKNVQEKVQSGYNAMKMMMMMMQTRN